MKYADNITKVFASSSGVIITMIVSTYLFDFSMTLLFNLGTGTKLLMSDLLSPSVNTMTSVGLKSYC